MKDENKRNINIENVLKDTKLLKILLAKGIIKYEDIIDKLSLQQIFDIAENVENAPIDELAEGIIKTRNTIYIYYFARYVGGVDLTNYFSKIPNELFSGIYSAYLTDEISIDSLKIMLSMITYQLDNNKGNQDQMLDYFKKFVDDALKSSNKDAIDIIIANTTNPLLIDILKKEIKLFKETQEENNNLYDNLVDLYNSGNIEEIEKRKEEFAYLFNKEDELNRVSK